MGSIGAPELIIVVLIFMMLIVPIVIAVKVVSKANAPNAMNPALAPCRACGRAISVNAPACPQCGEPRAPLQG